MAEDPLAEVIAGVLNRGGVSLQADLTAAVRAAGYVSKDEVRSHLAGVLGAQQAEWEDEYPRGDEPEWHIAKATLNSLRAALLGTTEEAEHQPAQAPREQPRTPPGETNQPWEQYQPPIGRPRGATDLVLDDRPRCSAEGRYEGDPIPCDLHAGHTGPHEWYGPYDGTGGKTWRKRGTTEEATGG